MGGILCTAYILEGAIEAIPNDFNFDKIRDFFSSLLDAFQNYTVDFLDLQLGGQIIRVKKFKM